VTQPARRKGRGLALAPTAISELATSLGIRVHRPIKVGESQTLELLKGEQADLFVVIAYGQILPENLLTIPKEFAINLHASLLPKYRGAAPINWALIKGEKATGLSVIKITKDMDAGPIILQKKIDILNTDDALSLEQKLSISGVDLLLESLKLISDKKCKFSTQDQKKRSFAPRLSRDDGLIDWKKPAGEIINLIRGCSGWPQAYTYFNQKILKVFSAEISRQPQAGALSAGEISEISKSGISIITGKGTLLIKELQLEGKKRMEAEEFLLGYKVVVGDRLGENNI